MSDAIPTKPFALTLPDNGGVSIMLCGSTRSGKSSALSYILERYFKKHLGVLFTNSPQAEIYKKMDIIQSDRYLPKVLRDSAYINKKTDNRYPFLFVLDDVVTNIKFDKELLKALTIYRNSNISVIQCIQALALLNSSARTNVNYVLLFKFNSDEQVEKAIRMYLTSYFPKGMSMLDKMREYRRLTNDHYFFMVDNLSGGVTRHKIDLAED